MRIVKRSCTSHLKGIRRTDFHPTLELSHAFVYIHHLLKSYESQLDVMADTDVHYELWTNNGFRTSSTYPKARKGIQFAAAIIFPNHVGFYFLPLYIDRQLDAIMSTRLRLRRTGLTCLHFTSLADEMQVDLQKLISAGWDLYKRKGLVR